MKQPKVTNSFKCLCLSPLLRVRFVVHSSWPWRRVMAIEMIDKRRLSMGIRARRSESAMRNLLQVQREAQSLTGAEVEWLKCCCQQPRYELPSFDKRNSSLKPRVVTWSRSLKHCRQPSLWNWSIGNLPGPVWQAHHRPSLHLRTVRWGDYEWQIAVAHCPSFQTPRNNLERFAILLPHHTNNLA